MPKYLKPPPPKSAELVEREHAANMALMHYFKTSRGVQAQLARDTGISAPMISRMGSQLGYPISLEQAMLIEVATGGELLADSLCPSRADLIQCFLQLRNKNRADGLATA